MNLKLIKDFLNQLNDNYIQTVDTNVSGINIDDSDQANPVFIFNTNKNGQMPDIPLPLSELKKYFEIAPKSITNVTDITISLSENNNDFHIANFNICNGNEETMRACDILDILNTYNDEIVSRCITNVICYRGIQEGNMCPRIYVNRPDIC